MNRIRLLLVEDNPGDADLVHEHLSDCRDAVYEIETVDRLSHALPLLCKHAYDIILLDLTLPDSTGFATFTRIRECNARVPVVILSGLHDEALALEALRRGAQDYLVKGQVDGPAINRILQYALARHQLDDMKRDFISMVNHELRTPFTSVHLALQLLNQKDAVKADAETAKLVETACDNSTYLLNLINNILDYERLEKSGFTDKLETIDLIETGHKAIANTAVLAGQSGITCTLRTSLHDARVSATPAGLMQVVVNLLSNAIKFSPEQGDVTVFITSVNGAYRVSVTDFGPGVPSQLAETLFQKFARGKAVQKKQKGSGLGLAICKKLVEGYGGSINFVSEPGAGKGTTFFFDLPSVNAGSADIQDTGYHSESA